MTQLVHITAENVAKKIRRNGIAARRWLPGGNAAPEHDRAVWAFPVLPSYTLTHSWSRELKRRGRTTLVAVTFRISDDEDVYVRRYANAPKLVSAAKAVSIIRSKKDARGYEIIVPRRISPHEIDKIKILPRAIGWRYSPTAKGAPKILSTVCMPRGEVRAKRYRQRMRKKMAEAEIDD